MAGELKSSPNISTIIGILLTKIANSNDDLLSINKQQQHQHSPCPINLQVQYIINKLDRYSPVDPFIWIVALILIDRIATSPNTLLVTSSNVGQLLLLAFITASKLLLDTPLSNKYFGSVPLHQLNSLEMQFLDLSHFDLIVSYDQVMHYAQRLSRYALSLRLTADQENSRNSINHFHGSLHHNNANNLFKPRFLGR